MEELLYIQKYYHYLIFFLLTCFLLIFKGYIRNKTGENLIAFTVILFAIFTVNYIGSRTIEIGIDTYNYKYAFDFYSRAEKFEIRKDPFYDLLSFSFSKIANFRVFLTFNAFLYVFGALYSFRKIFKKDYYFPFMIFLISPYFFQFSINVMRNGVAASLFLIGLALYYVGEKKWKIFTCLLFAGLFHISIFFVLIAFVLTYFIKSTWIIFLSWLTAILLGLLKLNIISKLVTIVELFTTRASAFIINDAGKSSWRNFLIFGAFPVLFGVYNVILKKCNDVFFKRLLNIYMIMHIPYIILINSTRALRLGYLADFMMPILVLYPIFSNSPVLKIRYIKLRLTGLIFVLFMIKAYKILII